MRRAIIYIVIFAFFCIALGITIDRLYIKSNILKFIEQYNLSTTPGQRQNARRELILKRLKRKLDLTVEQYNKISDIIKEAKPSIDQARDNFIDNIRQIKQNVSTRIMDVLDSNQKGKFQQLLNADKEPFRKK